MKYVVLDCRENIDGRCLREFGVSLTGREVVSVIQRVLTDYPHRIVS